MSFEDWKLAQIELGYLALSKLSKQKGNGRFTSFPYKCDTIWASRYNALGSGSKIKAKGKTLTFDEYLYKAFEAGVTSPDGVGNGVNRLQLSRIGDIGSYDVDNCRFVLGSINIQERIDNGGAARSGDKQRGVSKPQSGLKGKLNNSWIGYWHTPNGIFEDTYTAGDVNGCSQSTILSRCQNCDRIVTRLSANFWRMYGEGTIGKTYRELGWYFESK